MPPESMDDVVLTVLVLAAVLVLLYALVTDQILLGLAVVLLLAAVRALYKMLGTLARLEAELLKTDIEHHAVGTSPHNEGEDRK